MLAGLAHRVFHDSERRSHEGKILSVRSHTAQKARKLLNRDKNCVLQQLSRWVAKCENDSEPLSPFLHGCKKMQGGVLLMFCREFEPGDVARRVPVFTIDRDD